MDLRRARPLADREGDGQAPVAPGSHPGLSGSIDTGLADVTVFSTAPAADTSPYRYVGDRLQPSYTAPQRRIRPTEAPCIDRSGMIVAGLH
jgi:hypothetical protein